MQWSAEHGYLHCEYLIAIMPAGTETPFWLSCPYHTTYGWDNRIEADGLPKAEECTR